MNDKLKNVWIEKYRPTNINELACSDELRNFINNAIKEKDFPNLLLYGTPGNGKNSIINILINNINCTYLSINASSETGIDNIRENVDTFANTTSFDRNLKVVILNEIDGMSYVAQQSLKEIMETTLDNCRFIITTNNKNKVNEAIVSRCVEFETDKIPCIEIAKRLCDIFDEENIIFENEYISLIIKKYNTNIRKMINESYKYYKMYGDLKAEYIEDKLDKDINDLFDFIFNTKDVKKINEKVKKQIFDNNIYTLLNQYCIEKFNNPNTVPIICEGEYRSRICNDKDLVLLSTIIEIKEVL